MKVEVKVSEIEHDRKEVKGMVRLRLERRKEGVGRKERVTM